jgi:glycosyltransferase EpsE
MGVYNCVDTLNDALESLLAQKYQNWDLVVCDDASTDGTMEILEDWRRRIPHKMTILHNDRNRKLSFSLNRCLAVASGDLIGRMDGDDLCHPERLEKQVDYLLNHPDVDLIGTSMRRFNVDGMADVVTPPEWPNRWTLRKSTPFCHATIVARRHVYERLSGYQDSPELERAEDLDLWFRFFAAGFTGHNLVEPLYFVREDLAAIRRRTVRNRLNVFQVTISGHSLLEYPYRWRIRVFLELSKALVPARGAALVRVAQRWRYGRRAST